MVRLDAQRNQSEPPGQHQGAHEGHEHPVPAVCSPAMHEEPQASQQVSDDEQLEQQHDGGACQPGSGRGLPPAPAQQHNQQDPAEQEAEVRQRHGWATRSTCAASTNPTCVMPAAVLQVTSTLSPRQPMTWPRHCWPLTVTVTSTGSGALTYLVVSAPEYLTAPQLRGTATPTSPAGGVPGCGWPAPSTLTSPNQRQPARCTRPRRHHRSRRPREPKLQPAAR